MKKLLYLLLCFACVVNLLPIHPSTAVSNALPTRPPTRQPHPQVTGGAPGGIRRDAVLPSPTLQNLSMPRRSPLWRILADFPYGSHVYTHSDILIFGYEDNTQLQVTDSGGNPVWSGTLNDGQHVALSPGGGVYLVAGSQPFSIVVGDQLTDYVWGYYAMDQYGHGLSTLLHTYQARWYDPYYDPHFIVFAYEDNTHVTVTDSTYGYTIWNGTLDAGEHYDNTSTNGQYLTVSADRPVAALSYTDQGYFVPSENGTFAGRIFYTFLGNSGEWDEYLNIIAYENTSVTVTDSDTGAYIWSGTLAAGQVHTVLGLNGRFVTVETSNLTAVSVHPAPYYTPGDYYHSLYAQDTTGTGIGTYFVLPAISKAWLVFFAYDDNSHVTIRDASGTTVYDGILNQGDWDYIYTFETIYTILSTGQVSAILDWGDKAGADFAPVHYAALQVDVVTPNGDTYRHGDTMLVAAHITQLSQGVLGATVTGRIEVNGPSDTLLFDLNDDGLYGDQTASDAIYSAEVPLSDPIVMPDGNYLLFVSAQKIEPDGSTSSGTGVSNFALAGGLERAPTVEVDVSGPDPGAVYAGDAINITATVVYSDSVDRPSTTVTARITRPDFTQVDLLLSYQNPDTWVGNYTCDLGGRYLVDVQARPPTDTPYAAGYGSTVVDVLLSRSPLSLTPGPLSSPYGRGDTVWLGVTVYAGGTPTDRANVFTKISPGDTVLPLENAGNGRYVAAYYADTPGTYDATIYASVPFYASNQTQVSFVVSNTSGPFADQIATFSEGTRRDMDNLRQTAFHVAWDGDWFDQQIFSDKVAIATDLIFGVRGLWKEAGNVLDSVTTDGLIRGYTPGLDGLRLVKDEVGIDGRAFESWASRTTHAMRESLLDRHYANRVFPKWVGPRVFERALVAYGAKYAEMTVEDFLQQLPEFVVDQIARAMSVQPLQDGIYIYLGEDVDEYKQIITDYTEATLIDAPAMTPTEEEAYRLDLIRRRQAGIHVAGAAYQRNAALFWAQDVREDQKKGLFDIFIKVLLHQLLRLLVGVLAEGPGVLIVDAGWTGAEFYQDLKNLHQDYQMVNFAQHSLVRISEEEMSLYTNALDGLVRIRHGESPHTAHGEITSIQEISRGAICWRGYCEQEVVSQITIRNTGTEDARFKPQACYYGTRKWGLEFFSHCIEGVRRVDGNHDLWISLSPGQQETVELLFKDENGHDVCPPDGTMISYVLFANNDTGTFFTDSDGQPLEPEREIRHGLFVANRVNLLHASTDDELEAIPHPIYLAVMPGGDGVDQFLHLEAINGYGFPINVTIVQPLPAGVEVSVPGGGYVEADQISWRTVIQPHDSFGVDFAVALPGLPTEVVAMPPAQLHFYLAQEDGTLSFYSSPVNLARRLPLRAEAKMPTVLSENVSVLVNVMNRGQGTESGTLILRLYNQQGAPLLSDTQAVQLCAGCSQLYTLALQPDVPSGVYALEVTLTVNDYTETVDTALVSYERQNQIYLPIVLRNYTPGAGWSTIMTENFEGTFPSGKWSVFDNDGASHGEYYWDEDDYKPHQGSRSAWPANGGADALDPQYANYPNYLDSWMVYGPFDLSDAADAELLFHYWNQSEQGYDYLFWGASVNGANFYGSSVSGDSGGWQAENFDLTNVYTLGDLTGQPAVWIAFVFVSDYSITDKGAFVDDIMLRKSAVRGVSAEPATVVVPERLLRSDAFSLSVGNSPPEYNPLYGPKK